MHITITGIHLDLTDALQKHTHTKFEKLNHYHGITNVHVTLETNKLTHMAKADLHMSLHQIHAEAEAADMYTAIDALLSKLEKQIIKHKDKLSDH